MSRRLPQFPRCLAGWLAFATLNVAIEARAQGSLTPPGAPAPTQKSLQEIWDMLGALEMRASTLESQNATFQSQNTALRSDVTALKTAATQERHFLESIFQDQLPWRVTTVDSAGATGEYTSLAFGPDGQPAISYYDKINGDLRFARFNGTSWSTFTVDAANDTGAYTSLAFGPDGQPAIAYHDKTNGRLRFARFSGASWSTVTADTGFQGANVGNYCSLAF